MSEWTKFVTNYYHEEKKKNPDYMFKNALKDAGPLFKQSNGADNSSANKKNKKFDFNLHEIKVTLILRV